MEEDHVTKAKLIPSSPSSSSSLHKPHLVTLSQIHENQQMATASWLSHRQDLLTSRLNTDSGPKFEFMDIVNDDEEVEGSRKEEPVAPIEKEHMFDKVVTPSDVGKLNRLVIPKQHAEKYFPLDSTTNEKGLLLNFEDRSGKAWRFRYSYWNSSQSYVMTKGWSRFVKDKKLDAGDIVSFQRGMGDSVKDRFFIDWRRRPDAMADHNSHSRRHHHFQQQQQHHYLSSIPWSPLLMQPPGMGMMQNSYSNGGRSSSYGYNCSNPGTIVYMRSAAPQMVQWQQGVGGQGGGSSGVVEPMVYESVPVVEGKAAAKRLRLFGVNMDCPIATESEECEQQLSSSTHHSLQLKPFNSTPMQPPSQFLHKGKSSMSFDLDI